MNKSFLSLLLLVANFTMINSALAETTLDGKAQLQTLKVFDGKVQICDQENINAIATRIVSASKVLSSNGSTSVEKKLKLKLDIVFLRCEKGENQQPKFVIIKKEATQIRTAEDNESIGNAPLATKMSLENHKISVMSVASENQRLVIAELQETADRQYHAEFSVPTNQNKIDVLLLADRVLEIQGNPEKIVDSAIGGAFRIIVK